MKRFPPTNGMDFENKLSLSLSSFNYFLKLCTRSILDKTRMLSVSPDRLDINDCIKYELQRVSIWLSNRFFFFMIEKCNRKIV